MASLQYPYCPTHITKPKEMRRLYLCLLPPDCIFAVPRNYKLLAVPLYELHGNERSYGMAIAGLPQLLSRFSFVYDD